jgi:hypothetical protein
METNLAENPPDVKCPYHGEQLQELWTGFLDCESCVLESARMNPYTEIEVVYE